MHSDLLNLIENLHHEKIVVLLAPSFPVDFSYPEIIVDLKKIGCNKVLELTYAAKLINMYYHDLIKKNPEKQYICTNCPTVVKFISCKYPDHKDKLIDIASPMVIMSRFAKQTYGSVKTLFIGPCLAKKIEAKESGDVDYAITFKELQEIFDWYKEYPELSVDAKYETNEQGQPDFDAFYNDYTKVYPLTGAVAQTMNYQDILTDDQVLIVDEIKNLPEAMEKFINTPHIKFFDSLACPGGCIGGPGMISKASIPEREQKVKDYKEKAKHSKERRKLGKFSRVENLDMKSNIIK